VKSFKDVRNKSTDRWYKNQPEWGTDESDYKARKITPGQKNGNKSQKK